MRNSFAEAVPQPDGGADLRLSELRRSPVPGIEATPDAVLFVGVELKKCEGGPNTPNVKFFERDSITRTDLLLMRDIAACWSINQVPCIEGGPGIGKTHTVQRMGAYLNQEVFKTVCDPETTPGMLFGKVTTDPTKPSGFGFVPGIVTEAITRGGILFLDEYNALPNETKLRLRDVLDALANGQRTFLLKENSEVRGGELITINPNFRIVMAQNEPDGSSAILQPLPEPDFSRIVYMKYPQQLSALDQEARFVGKLGLAPSPELTKPDYLCRNPEFSVEKLGELLGTDELKRDFYKKYKLFTAAVETLVTRMEIAKDQAQPLSFNAQRDADRVLGFIGEFYDGNLQSITQRALRMYFANRFESSEDRAKIEELISKFQIDTPKPVGRVDLPEDISVSPALPQRPVVRELEMTRAELEGAIMALEPGQRFLIGRGFPSIDPGRILTDTSIKLTDVGPGVSRVHVAIERNPSGQLYLTDLGSTRGTSIIRMEGAGGPAELTLSGSASYEAFPGDVVRMGSGNEFRICAPLAVAGAGPGADPAAPPPPEPPAVAGPRIERLTCAPLPELIRNLKPMECLSIGRAPTVWSTPGYSQTLVNLVEDLPGVGRNQVVVEMDRDGAMRVHGTGSTNPTVVVKNSGRHVLTVGDSVQVSLSEGFVVQLGAGPRVTVGGPS